MNTAEQRQHVSGQAHPSCFVCSPRHLSGMGLRFIPQGDGSVAAEFSCDALYEGYEGMVHGGIISTLLDGAMTHCLFALGHVAVTADLHVRFRHPLYTGQEATVRAKMTCEASPLFVLEAQVVQAGQVKATAIGKFMRKQGSALGDVT